MDPHASGLLYHSCLQRVSPRTIYKHVPGMDEDDYYQKKEENIKDGIPGHTIYYKNKEEEFCFDCSYFFL